MFTCEERTFLNEYMNLYSTRSKYTATFEIRLSPVCTKRYVHANVLNYFV